MLCKSTQLTLVDRVSNENLRARGHLSSNHAQNQAMMSHLFLEHIAILPSARDVAEPILVARSRCYTNNGSTSQARATFLIKTYPHYSSHIHNHAASMVSKLSPCVMLTNPDEMHVHHKYLAFP